MRIMKKINMEQVFDTLKQQQKNLNRCLGRKNNTYRQILMERDKFSSAQQWNMISYLKTAQELLTSEEYAKLWALPKFRALEKVIENILYNLKYEPSFALDSDCFYLSQRDFENYALFEEDFSADFVLLPYGQEYQIYEFVMSGVFLKSRSQPSAEDKAFIHSLESEFIVGYYKTACFVVRVVSDIYQDENTMKEIVGRYDYGLSFSRLRPKHIKFVQAQMLELRKKLMLWMEYKKKILLPGELGSIGLVDMMEHYPSIGKYGWQRIFNMLLNDKAIFSKKLWQKLATSDLCDGIFNGVKMMLQKYDGNPDVEKDSVYFYFVDDLKNAAVRIFWRKGWMAEVFVQYKASIEFPVLTNGLVYVVKTVKDLSKEPLVHELYLHENPHYIWN